MRPINFVSANEALRIVKSHGHIYTSSAAYMPFLLIEHCDAVLMPAS